MKSSNDIIIFIYSQIEDYKKLECWSCVNALQDVIAYIQYPGSPMPTEDDEKIFEQWEDLEYEDRLIQERADTDLNFIKSNQ